MANHGQTAEVTGGFELTMVVPPVRPVETIPFRDDGRQFVLLRDPLGFSDKMIAVAEEAVPLLALMDGKSTGDQIIEAFRMSTGADVEPDQLVALIDMLEDARLLQSDAFLEHRQRLEDEFKRSPVREAILAGNSYPADPAELTMLLDSLLSSGPDPDVEPESPKPGKMLRGIMLPHIDFDRGGMTYGRGYRQAREFIDDLRGPVLVGIIGVAHLGGNYPIIATSKNFETPLGALQSDKQAIKILREELGEAPFVEEWAHKNEHSLELQSVWLKHLMGTREFTILPVAAGILAPGKDGTLSSNEEIEKVVSALQRIEREHDGSVLWVASVDLAHMGPHFGDDKAVDTRMRADTAKFDQEALEYVRKADAEGWWNSLMVDDNARRICGLNATYLWLRMMQKTTGVFVDYHQAVSEDNELMVSFAAGLQQAL